MKPPSESSGSSSLAPLIAQGAIAVGIVMILVSFFVPTRAASESLWTAEKAVEYQQSALRVHQLSHVSEEASRDPEAARQHDEELAAAQKNYDQIRNELDAATRRPVQLVAVLRWGGVIAAVGGIAGYLASKNSG